MGNDSDDQFIILKRADYDLDNAALQESEYKLERQRSIALSKKALAKKGPKGHKLDFDDSGAAHEVYELRTRRTCLRMPIRSWKLGDGSPWEAEGGGCHGQGGGEGKEETEEAETQAARM